MFERRPQGILPTFNQQCLPITTSTKRGIMQTTNEEDARGRNATFGGSLNNWLNARWLSEDELGVCEVKMSVELGRSVCRVDGGGNRLGSDYCKPNQGIPDLSYPQIDPVSTVTRQIVKQKGGGNSRFEQQRNLTLL